MRRRPLMLILGFAVVALLGYWLAGTAAPRKVVRDVVSEPQQPKRTVYVDEPAPKFRKAERGPAYRRDDEASNAGALPGQRILVFKDQSALEEFLKRAGGKVSLLGRLDALNALRIGFSDADELASLLGDKGEQSLVFPVDLPPPPGEGSAQAGAVPLGAGLLEWLGVTGDNSAWGSGVRIAILDTGVTASPAFGSKISSLDLIDSASGQPTKNGHGTAVASMIIGQNSLTPGVAPGADIVSVRIANDLGQSDSFLLAQGIVAAVDAGARLINISMGSNGDSALVRNAIAYAREAGSLIIAAAGNNGLQQVSYPAADEGVIAVGAVDALGNHLDFSNSGNQVAISAPGFGVNAAWLGDQAARVSGTSFSSPIVTGAIAALMSQPGAGKLTANQAVNLLFTYLNDGGEAGTDAAMGAGMPDLGRAMNAKTPGIYDAALASQRIIPPSPGNPNGQIEILVQNRGTETLINTAVRISTPNGVVNSNITSLPVNAVKTIRVPIPNSSTANLRYDSRVNLSGDQKDVKPSNDHRVETYVPAGRK